MRRSKVSPTFVVAVAALVLASAGGAVAAATITGAQVKDSSLTGRDVKNKSLTRKDFRGSIRGARGFDGADGAAGPQGPQGPAGPVNVGGIVSAESTVTIPAGGVGSTRANCPPGYGVISGGFVAIAVGDGVFFEDSFDAPGWSVGLDNFDSSVSGDLTAIAFCAPSGKAVLASRKSYRREMGRLERKQLAMHR